MPPTSFHTAIVDAVFAPALRYFDVLDTSGDFRFFAGVPRVAAWRSALSRRSSVRRAAPADYERRLREFLSGRGSALSRRLAGATSA